MASCPNGFLSVRFAFLGERGATATSARLARPAGHESSGTGQFVKKPAWHGPWAGQFIASSCKLINPGKYVRRAKDLHSLFSVNVCFFVRLFL